MTVTGALLLWFPSRWRMHFTNLTSSSRWVEVGNCTDDQKNAQLSEISNSVLYAELILGGGNVWPEVCYRVRDSNGGLHLSGFGLYMWNSTLHSSGSKDSRNSENRSCLVQGRGPPGTPFTHIRKTLEHTLQWNLSFMYFVFFTKLPILSWQKKERMTSLKALKGNIGVDIPSDL